MPEASDISLDDLDELYDTLSEELRQLVELSEALLAEMDAVDEARISIKHEGRHLLDARRVRLAAMSARTQAIERRQEAIRESSRARELAERVQSSLFRAVALTDAPEPRPAPRREAPEQPE